MKRDRIAEIHFYEWRIGAWATSETRDRLDASGRGIYRELLDHCYGQGRFPDDPEWICRRCACAPEQFEKTWKVIARHFPKVGRTAYRYNVHADIVRDEYFSYVEKQRSNRKNRTYKPNGNRELDNGGSTTVEPSDEHVVNGGSTNDNGNDNGNDDTTATTTAKENPKPHAAADADGLRVVRPRRGKRTTEEIAAALGARLPWWEEFWRVYPEHRGMNEAMDTFERKVTTKELALEIYYGAKRYAATCAAEPDSKMKYGQGWLNAERWKDPAVPARASPPAQISSVAQVRRQEVLHGLELLDQIRGHDVR